MRTDNRGGSVKIFRCLALEGTKPDKIKSCFYVQGKTLRRAFSEILYEICKKEKINRYKLSREITIQLGTERSTVLKYFREKNYFPVYLLNILLSKLPKSKADHFCAKIQRDVEFFKVGTSVNWTKFPKRLNREIAWLAGAISADGWISRDKNGKERLGIVDQNKDALDIAAKYFEQLFGLKMIVEKNPQSNSWLLIVDNKAIIKFFVHFLDFSYGRKTYTISEPTIIKKSHYRLDFAKGLLCFDGSVELDSTVSIGLHNEKLIKELYGILNEKGYHFKYSRPDAKISFIRSPYLYSCKNSKKWISLFGENSTKGNRLKFLITGSTKKPSSENEAIKSLESMVRKNHISKLSIKDIFYFAQKRKRFTKHEIMSQFNIGHGSFWKYVMILRRSNIVKDEGEVGRGKKFYYVYNPNIQEWNIPSLVS